MFGGCWHDGTMRNCHQLTPWGPQKKTVTSWSAKVRMQLAKECAALLDRAWYVLAVSWVIYFENIWKRAESEVASCCLKAKDLCPLAMPTAPCFTWQGVFHQPCLLTAGNLIFQGTFKMVKASSQSLPPQSWRTLWSIWNLWDITLQLTKNWWKGRVMQVKTHQCSPPSCISKDKALSTVASVYLRIRRWCGLGFLKAAHSLSLPHFKSADK